MCGAHARAGPTSCAAASPLPPHPAPAKGWDPSVGGASVLCLAAALASAAVFLKGFCCVFQGAAKIAFATDPRENKKTLKNSPGKVTQSKEKLL